MQFFIEGLKLGLTVGAYAKALGQRLRIRPRPDLLNPKPPS